MIDCWQAFVHWSTEFFADKHEVWPWAETNSGLLSLTAILSAIFVAWLGYRRANNRRALAYEATYDTLEIIKNDLFEFINADISNQENIKIIQKKISIQTHILDRCTDTLDMANMKRDLLHVVAILRLLHSDPINKKKVEDAIKDIEDLQPALKEVARYLKSLII